MKNPAILIGLILTVMAPVAAQAQNQDHPPRRQTVKFDRISAELPMGQVFARGKLGLLCVQHEAWTWNGASQWINLDMFVRAFHETALAYGLPVAGDPTSLFGDQGYQDSDFLIGAQIRELQLDACAPMGGFGNTSSIKGRATMTVEWQVYSKRAQRLVYRTTTRSAIDIPKAQPGGMYTLVLAPFRDNIRQLADDKMFQFSITN